MTKRKPSASCPRWGPCTTATSLSVRDPLESEFEAIHALIRLTHSPQIAPRKPPDDRLHLCQPRPVCPDRRPGHLSARPPLGSRTADKAAGDRLGRRPHALCGVLTRCPGHVSIWNTPGRRPAKGHVRRGQGVQPSNGRRQPSPLFQRRSDDRHQALQRRSSAFSHLPPIVPFGTLTRLPADERVFRTERHPASVVAPSNVPRPPLRQPRCGPRTHRPDGTRSCRWVGAVIEERVSACGRAFGREYALQSSPGS